VDPAEKRELLSQILALQVGHKANETCHQP
jgi:hypothetical protein